MVTLFRLNKPMQIKDPDLYMRSLYYLNVMLFMTDNAPDLKKYLDRMKQYISRHGSNLNPNSQHISFVYYQLSRFNYCFLTKDFTTAYQLIAEVKQALPIHEPLMDNHRLMLFYYKFAIAAFQCNQWDEALGHLHPILYKGRKHYKKVWISMRDY
ncbi:MAG: hypothetical protein R2795_17590 [Saprospiraceae bacterium]